MRKDTFNKLVRLRDKAREQVAANPDVTDAKAGLCRLPRMELSDIAINLYQFTKEDIAARLSREDAVPYKADLNTVFYTLSLRQRSEIRTTLRNAGFTFTGPNVTGFRAR